MKKKTKKISVVKATVLAIVLGGLISPASRAAIPILNVGDAERIITTGIQHAAKIQQQVEHHTKRIAEYENMIKQLDSFNWGNTKDNIDKLLKAQNALAQHKAQLGGLQKYLDSYKNLASYLKSPCFTSAGCSASERQALLDAQANASQAQKLANDSVLKGVDQQQESLKEDASQLTKLQGQVKDAKGQMQAQQAASQLASAQVNQMQHIRALLIAQQTAEATRNQVIADREAQEMAASRQLRNSANIQVDNKPATLSWGK